MSKGGLRGPRRTGAALAIVLAWALAPVPARAETPVSIQPTRVAAGFFFNGATFNLQGTVDAASQVVVRVLGPSDRRVYNRRDKIAGLIWGGVEHVSFRGAPDIYGIYSSAAVSSVADAGLRARLLLGYDALAAQVHVEGATVDGRAVVTHLLRLKEHEHLYWVRPGAVHLDDADRGRRQFRVAIDLPATVPAGEIEVAVFEFSHGVLVSTQVTHVSLERVGVPAWLFRFAHEHGVGFGLLAVACSLATGLVTGLVARRRPARRGHPGAGADGTPGHAAETASFLPAAWRTLRQALSAHPFGPGRVGDTEELRARYGTFRDLLSVNSEVLALLTELEEESSWTSFRQPRVRMGIRALFDGTADMVRLLNELADDRFFDLANVVSSIRRDVMDFLAKTEQQGDVRLTLQLSEITSATEGRAGGKAVNLARLECDLGFRVPESFVVTTDAYRAFLEHDGLGGELRTLLAPARLDAPVDFARRCELAQEVVDQAPIPPAILEAIDRAYVGCGIPDADGAAVRSSASGEDSELSFAGQFETVLNVPRAEIGAAWKRVVRSRFAPRAVFYRRAAGLAEVDTPMAVLVQRMIRSRVSGVLFTKRPDAPREPVLLVTSVLGLGPEVSAGIANADEIVVTRRTPHRVIERRIARKPTRLVGAAGGGIVREAVCPDEQVRSTLSDAELGSLVDRALATEHYFGGPQDIEWTVDQQGGIFLLQSRPLRVEQGDVAGAAIPVDAPLLLRGGQPVWTGRAVGPIFVARTGADEERIPEGSMLVVPQLSPDCVRFLQRICGVIVEQGTVTGHAASIVREFRVPSLFGVDSACEKLVPGQSVSLDVASRSVFAGVLWPDLQGRLPLAVGGRETIGLPSALAGKLTKLNGSSFMSSWACQSLHDVIRFAHESAILAMFEIGDRLVGSSLGGVKKLAGPPHVYVHLLDLGGGLRPEAARKRTVELADVQSSPFRALWSGLSDDTVDQQRPDLPEPRQFASVLASTVTAEGGRALGVPNYAAITDTYVNLNSRQAYHFAIVDAFLGETESNNHISLRLKGGGAARWQRTLRAEFMAEVLRLHRFTTSVIDDTLTAWTRGIDRDTGAERLATIGRLLRFSAQLDLWMTDLAHVKAFVAAFVEAEARTAAVAGAAAARTD